MIWKLKHCLYGLKDGARQFYLSVKDELSNLSFVTCSIEPAMLYLKLNEKLKGKICCHVDDFLHAGDKYFDKAMNRLRQRFFAGKEAEGNFSYIGFEIQQDEKGITLDHSNYMKKLRTVDLDPKKLSE